MSRRKSLQCADIIVRFAERISDVASQALPKNDDDACAVKIDARGLFEREGEAFVPLGPTKGIPAGPVYLHLDLGKRLVERPEQAEVAIAAIKGELDLLGKSIELRKLPNKFDVRYDATKGDLYISAQPILMRMLSVPDMGRRSAVGRIAASMVSIGISLDGVRRLRSDAESIRATSPLALQLQAKQEEADKRQAAMQRGDRRTFDVTLPSDTPGKPKHVKVGVPASDGDILRHGGEVVAGGLIAGMICGSSFTDAHLEQFRQAVQDNLGLGGLLAQEIAEAKEHRAAIRRLGERAR
jgi:hypothetical protein